MSARKMLSLARGSLRQPEVARLSVTLFWHQNPGAALNSEPVQEENLVPNPL